MPHCPLAPCADYVVLTPEEAPHTGLLLLLSDGPRNWGTVAACGPDVAELEEGFLVVHRPLAVTSVTVGTERWTLVREADVVARLAV